MIGQGRIELCRRIIFARAIECPRLVVWVGESGRGAGKVAAVECTLTLLVGGLPKIVPTLGLRAGRVEGETQHRQRQGEKKPAAESERCQQYRKQQQQIADIVPAIGHEIGLPACLRRLGRKLGKQRGDVLIVRCDQSKAPATGLCEPAQAFGIEPRRDGASILVGDGAALGGAQFRALAGADAEHAELIARAAHSLRCRQAGGRIKPGIIGNDGDVSLGCPGTRQEPLRLADGEIEPVAEHRHQARRQFRQHLADDFGIGRQRGGDEGAVGIDHQRHVAALDVVEHVAQLLARAGKAAGHQIGAVHRLREAEHDHRRFRPAIDRRRQLFPGRPRHRQNRGGKCGGQGGKPALRSPRRRSLHRQVPQQMGIDQCGPAAISRMPHPARRKGDDQRCGKECQ